MSRKSGALTYPEPLGPPRPIAEDLYFLLLYHHFSTCTVWNPSVPYGERTSKGTIFSLHARKASRGHTHIAPVILNLSTSYRYVVTFTPKPLYAWEKNNGTLSTGD